MLEDISAFCVVAEHKSFSKAARQLEISAAVVTRRIMRLEKFLGARLLQRSTRHVNLTEAGQIYYSQVRDALTTLENSKKMVKNLTEEVTGTLKVGLPASLSYLHITPALHQFTKKFPQLKIQIVHGNHLLDLLSNGFDMVIHCSKLPDSNFYYKKIGEWKKIICASPAYLKKHGVPKIPQELSLHQCVDHYDNSVRVWKFKVGNKIEEVMINANIYVNSSMDLKNLAVQGAGIAYLPSFTVYHELKAGRLISILENYQPPSIDMLAVYPSREYLNKKTKLFLDFLAKVLCRTLITKG